MTVLKLPVRLSFLNTLKPVSSVLLSVQARLTVLPEADAVKVAGVVGGRFYLSQIKESGLYPEVIVSLRKT